MKSLDSIQPIERALIQAIKKRGTGVVVFPSDFVLLGSQEAVKKAFQRLEGKKALLRLGRGIYVYPKKHRLLGVLQPSIEEVANAIGRRDRARIAPAGALALNKLGLSTQVPMNVVFYTDGSARLVPVGRTHIRFKRVAPRFFQLKGPISTLAVAALNEIGARGLTPTLAAKIHKHLTAEEKEHLIHDAHLVPNWIRAIFLEALKQRETTHGELDQPQRE